jgi:hypothetical protein
MLYPADVLNSLIVSFLWVESLVSSTEIILLLCNLHAFCNSGLLL